MEGRKTIYRKTFTPTAIREMHKILLREPYETEAVTLDNKIIRKLVKLGEYKVTANFVRTGSGEIHQYASPEDVSPRMKELIDWHRDCEKKTDLHPVIHAAIFHHKFLAIHPFDDGNGRMGRILMNLILMRHGFPPVVIKLAARDPYIAALRRADAGETAGIVSFFGENLLDAERLFLRGATGESIEDADDVDKEIALLKQELAHVEPTLALSPQLQRAFLDKSIMPLLSMVEAKLKQFDELFSYSSVEVTIRLPALPPRPPRSGRPVVPRTQPLIKSTGVRGSAMTLVSGLFTKNPMLIDLVTISFRWQKFTRANLNAFDLDLVLELRFEELQLQIKKSAPDTLLIAKRYSSNLSREEMNNISTALAKTVLDSIRKQTLEKP